MQEEDRKPGMAGLFTAVCSTVCIIFGICCSSYSTLYFHKISILIFMVALGIKQEHNFLVRYCTYKH